MVTMDQVIAHLQKGFKVKNKESGRVIMINPNDRPGHNNHDSLRFEKFEYGYTVLTFGYSGLFTAPDTYELLDTEVTVIPYEDLLEERNRLLARVKILEDRLYKAVNLLKG